MLSYSAAFSYNTSQIQLLALAICSIHPLLVISDIIGHTNYVISDIIGHINSIRSDIIGHLRCGVFVFATLFPNMTLAMLYISTSTPFNNIGIDSKR